MRDSARLVGREHAILRLGIFSTSGKKPLIGADDRLDFNLDVKHPRETGANPRRRR